MALRAGFRLAIDVGGTFTDVVLVNEADGSVHFGKVLSTPEDPSIGSVSGASQVMQEHGVTAAEVDEVIHATTVATNAVLERRGGQTALLTTRGFRDTLEIGREARYDIYDLDLRMPEPLIPRPLRREIDERMSAEGVVITELDPSEVRRVLNELVAAGVGSVAVSLLHSYANPAHEQRVAEIARHEFAALEVSVSCEVAGEAREFERTSTVCVDAYVKPLVRRYIAALEQRLRELGFRRQLALMLSHGGIGAANDVAARFPVRMIESGPAAGAIAAAYFSKQVPDLGQAIAFDMGGTTAKMSLVRGGVPAVANEYEVAHVHRFRRGSGIPLQISAIDLLEIGAGGGSIAHLNKLGLLTVGPESAGAQPGPVCYARGGVRPTVTDADLVLGYLNPDFFLGGDMSLDLPGARAAMASEIGPALGMSVEQVAWGIHDIVNEQMSAAIRAHCAEKAVDLRQLGLIAFGGAGPVHAYAVARKLGLSRVVCPFGAGVASSIGCLVAAPAVDLVSACPVELDALDWSDAAARFAAMRESGAAVIEHLVGEGAALRIDPQFEMRCAGQGYSVLVTLPADLPIGAALAERLADDFRSAYAHLYGHRPPEVALEIVNLRARVWCERESAVMRPSHASQSPDAGSAAAKGVRQVYFEAASCYLTTQVLDRYALRPGDGGHGPAVIEERETSIVVGPDARFSVDAQGHVVIEIEAAGKDAAQ